MIYITMSDMIDVCDAHEFDIVWSVLIFDAQIFYKDEGLIDGLKVRFRKKDGRIYFLFVGDPSLNYSHDFNLLRNAITDFKKIT